MRVNSNLALSAAAIVVISGTPALAQTSAVTDVYKEE